MRWERLFDDLEAQVAADARWELEAEVADRTRTERATVDLMGRLLGARQAQVTVTVRTLDGASHAGRVGDVGSGWVVLEDDRPATVLLPMTACAAFVGMPRAVGVAGQVARRLGVGSALRAIARDRAAVEVVDLSGISISGTIDAVGADHVEIAEHPADLARRSGNVRSRSVVPFAALASVAQRSTRTPA